MVTFYWGIVYALLLCMFLLLVINLSTFPRLYESFSNLTVMDMTGTSPCHVHGNQVDPFLSILVPARDEEACIETCVRSLVEQDYGQLEVLVLDDHSSDATGAIVQRIIDELPPEQTGRLRLIQGEDLPQGWVGKNFACHQLAQQAQGDHLLFTDADTVHAPETARAVIHCMQHYGVKLLTAQPAFELGSMGERLVVPLLNFTIMTLLPVALVRLRPEPSLATGNGQFICFHRSAYEAISGHASVKGLILEDVLLARAVKAAGDRMIFVDALELVRCRMYRSFAEVWTGFSKNLFAFYNYSLPFALLALILNLALFVIPPLFALVGSILHLPLNGILAGLGAYALAVLMRVLLALRFTPRHSTTFPRAPACLLRPPDAARVTPTMIRSRLGEMLFLCFLHPLSIMLECLILLNSIRWRYRKRGTVWKGRQYK